MLRHCRRKVENVALELCLDVHLNDGCALCSEYFGGSLLNGWCDPLSLVNMAMLLAAAVT